MGPNATYIQRFERKCAARTVEYRIVRKHTTRIHQITP